MKPVSEINFKQVSGGTKCQNKIGVGQIQKTEQAQENNYSVQAVCIQPTVRIVNHSFSTQTQYDNERELEYCQAYLNSMCPPQV